MFPIVDTKNPTAIAKFITGKFTEMFPDASPDWLKKIFHDMEDLFTGRHPDYAPCDIRYHDFEHTLQAALCITLLLEGRHIAQVAPKISARQFELALASTLLHDSGYLRLRSDKSGTGAKYTAVHVDRSGDFAAQFLARQGYGLMDIQAVRNMIHCTGVNVNLRAIPFQHDLDRLAGYALGTADLLGQMAADNYVEKLAELFEEFHEAATFSEKNAGFVGLFHSAEELMRRTPQFWQEYVLPKLRSDFEGVFQFLSRPCPGGPNWYLERAQSNVDRLRRLYPS